MFARLKSLLDASVAAGAKIEIGGRTDEQDRYVAPTVLSAVPLALLKRAMAADLPPEILTRKKMGFGVPLSAWLRRELRDMTRDVLLGSRARERGIFRASEVEALIAMTRYARLLDGREPTAVASE